MVSKTKKKKKHYTQSKRRGIIKRKTSKKVKKIIEKTNESSSIWGKNKPLEKFWKKLANGENVVVIYKNGKHKYVDLPKSNIQKSKLYDDFDANEEIIAVLSSSRSTDTYELFLYPKAKDSSVEDVITNYKKYFEFLGPNVDTKKDEPLMKKVMIPK